MNYLYPSPLSNYSTPVQKRTVNSAFLSNSRKNPSQSGGVGINFADISAIQSVLYAAMRGVKQSPASPVNNITVYSAGRKRSRSDSYVTETVILVGVQNSNEPSVLCQSTFL
ncbi:MAG: hypothetical protein ACT4OJ_00955 [Bacteroidota bacterium]